MNFSFLIARKYFWSKDKKNFINIISIISMLVVGIATMALVVILSVFNGLEELLRDLYGSFDPDIKIEAAAGKSFVLEDKMIAQIEKTEGVAGVVQVIEDNAYLKYDNAELVATIKGVSKNYLELNNLESKIIDGQLKLWDEKVPLAVVGQGVQFNLAISIGDEFTPLYVYYPKNLRTRSLDPNSALTRRVIPVTGVFAIERQFDEKYVLVPLEFARDLLNYDNKVTALEVKLNPGYGDDVIDELKSTLGADYKVLGADEQHAVMLRTVKIEKLFVFLTFTFIMGVSSINIFFALSMLAIDKKQDLKTFFSMGARPGQVRGIFLSEGAVISFSGALFGLVVGFILVWLQKEIGLVGMGLETAVVKYYPVKIEWFDFFATSLAIILITVLASLRPASMAVRYGDNELV
ncbi:MAG: FtsX-like permease family protein [Bacteroidota bacterium]